MSACPFRVLSYDPALHLTRSLAYGTIEAAFRDAAEQVGAGNHASVWCVGDDGVARPVGPTKEGKQ